MENQHCHITGHRELTEDEIALMNEIEEHGVALSGLMVTLRLSDNVDQHWVSIGITDLQTGLMALTRAVAKPDFF